MGPVKEDDSIAKRQEVFGGGSTTRPSREVVDKANCVCFERYCRATRSHKNDGAILVMLPDEIRGEGAVGLQRGGCRIILEIAFFGC